MNLKNYLEDNSCFIVLKGVELIVFHTCTVTFPLYFIVNLKSMGNSVLNKRKRRSVCAAWNIFMNFSCYYSDTAVRTRRVGNTLLSLWTSSRLRFYDVGRQQIPIIITVIPKSRVTVTPECAQCIAFHHTRAITYIYKKIFLQIKFAFTLSY
jgi:hypothetical protein